MFIPPENWRSFCGVFYSAEMLKWRSFQGSTHCRKTPCWINRKSRNYQSQQTSSKKPAVTYKTNQLSWRIVELLRSFKSYLPPKMSSPSTLETISGAFSIYCVVRGDLTKYFVVQHHIQTLDIHSLVHEKSTTKARDFTACDCIQSNLMKTEIGYVKCCWGQRKFLLSCIPICRHFSSFPTIRYNCYWCLKNNCNAGD